MGGGHSVESAEEAFDVLWKYYDGDPARLLRGTFAFLYQRGAPLLGRWEEDWEGTGDDAVLALMQQARKEADDATGGGLWWLLSSLLFMVLPLVVAAAFLTGKVQISMGGSTSHSSPPPVSSSASWNQNTNAPSPYTTNTVRAQSPVATSPARYNNNYMGGVAQALKVEVMFARGVPPASAHAAPVVRCVLADGKKFKTPPCSIASNTECRWDLGYTFQELGPGSLQGAISFELVVQGRTIASGRVDAASINAVGHSPEECVPLSVPGGGPHGELVVRFHPRAGAGGASPVQYSSPAQYSPPPTQQVYEPMPAAAAERGPAPQTMAPSPAAGIVVDRSYMLVKCKEYMEARFSMTDKSKKPGALVKIKEIVSDDIQLDHFKDGKKNGVADFMAYVDAVAPPNATPSPWDQWTVDGTSMTGAALVTLLSWAPTITVKVKIGFDNAGQINLIKMWR